MLTLLVILICLPLIWAILMINSKTYALIMSIFLKQRVVLLYDGDGKKYYSLEKISWNRCHIAYVYPSYQIGMVILLPNGGIHKSSPACYIKRWEYFNKKLNQNEIRTHSYSAN